MSAASAAASFAGGFAARARGGAAAAGLDFAAAVCCRRVPAGASRPYWRHRMRSPQLSTAPQPQLHGGTVPRGTRPSPISRRAAARGTRAAAGAPPPKPLSRPPASPPQDAGGLSPTVADLSQNGLSQNGLSQNGHGGGGARACGCTRGAAGHGAVILSLQVEGTR